MKGRNRMKRIVSFLLAVSLLFGMTACVSSEPAETGQTEGNTTAGATTSPASETTALVTEPEETASPTTVPTTIPDETTVPITEPVTDPTAEPTEQPTDHTHTYTDKTTVPTCTAKGYIKHTCTVCGYSYKDSYTDALGHDYKTSVIAPTCTADGYTLHKCSRCGESYKDNIVSATGHSYKTETVAPTTSSQGYDLHTCTVCGYSYKDNYTDKIAECDHEYEWVVYDNGRDVGTCTKCGATITLNPDLADVGDDAKEVLRLINEYRVAEGLNPLEWYTAGEECAKIRAVESSVNFAHMRPDGSYVNSLWRQYGINTGECIAAGNKTPKATVEQWMNSDGHRPTLMSETSAYAVIAHYYDPNSPYKDYWVFLSGKNT